jgi:hypothetical protein
MTVVATMPNCEERVRAHASELAKELGVTFRQICAGGMETPLPLGAILVVGVQDQRRPPGAAEVIVVSEPPSP